MSGAMRIDARVDIEAPPAVVWRCIDEPAQIVRWVEGAVEHRYLEERKPGHRLGQKFLQRLKQGRRIVEFEGTLIACDFPRHFAFTIPSPAYSSEAHFRLSPEGAARTRVDYSIEVTLHTVVAKIAGAVLRLPLGFFVRKQMRRLRDLAVSLKEGKA